jgi:hypothetical protein
VLTEVGKELLVLRILVDRSGEGRSLDVLRLQLLEAGTVGSEIDKLHPINKSVIFKYDPSFQRSQGNGPQEVSNLYACIGRLGIGINFRKADKIVDIYNTRFNGLCELTLSSFLGMVWIGIGCQASLEFHWLFGSLLDGGQSPAKSARQLIIARSASELWTKISCGE